MVAASASLKDSAEFQGKDLKRICMETLLSPELGLCEAAVEVMRVWLSLYKASTEMQVGPSVSRRFIRAAARILFSFVRR